MVIALFTRYSIKYPCILCKGKLGVGVGTYWGTILDHSGTRQLPLKDLSNIADKFGIVFETSKPEKFIHIGNCLLLTGCRMASVID